MYDWVTLAVEQKLAKHSKSTIIKKLKKLDQGSHSTLLAVNPDILAPNLIFFLSPWVVFPKFVHQLAVWGQCLLGESIVSIFHI